MSALELEVYEILKSRFSDKEAAKVIEYFDAKAEKKCDDKKDVLATKEDIFLVKKEISESKADIIKRMFLFWAGSILTTLGGLFAFLKIFLH